MGGTHKDHATICGTFFRYNAKAYLFYITGVAVYLHAKKAQAGLKDHVITAALFYALQSKYAGFLCCLRALARYNPCASRSSDVE